MRTALDLAESKLNNYEKKLIATIREHGWQHTYVSSDDNEPSFSYTTGLWNNLGIPELVTFSLPQANAHGMFWNIYRFCRESGPLPVGRPINHLAEGFDVQFMPVADAERGKYLLSSVWFYCGDAFPCLQMIWPDSRNVFPWQPGFDPHLEGDQPDLSPDGWLKRKN